MSAGVARILGEIPPWDTTREMFERGERRLAERRLAERRIQPSLTTEFINRLTQSRDDWKARALAAEAKLEAGR